jgi:hypothetical protein
MRKDRMRNTFNWYGREFLMNPGHANTMNYEKLKLNGCFYGSTIVGDIDGMSVAVRLVGARVGAVVGDFVVGAKDVIMAVGLLLVSVGADVVGLKDVGAVGIGVSVELLAAVGAIVVVLVGAAEGAVLASTADVDGPRVGSSVLVEVGATVEVIKVGARVGTMDGATVGPGVTMKGFVVGVVVGSGVGGGDTGDKVGPGVASLGVAVGVAVATVGAFVTGASLGLVVGGPTFASSSTTTKVAVSTTFWSDSDSSANIIPS